MSTFHTDHGTVRYYGIRRYIVVSNGRTVKRTDNFDTAHKEAMKHTRHGATIVDTVQEVAEVAARQRICTVCQHTHVPVDDWFDPALRHRHWHCIPIDERSRISSAWRAARTEEDNR